MNEEFRTDFVKSNNELIFSCMEAGKQQYESIMRMPVLRVTAYLKWKHKLEEEKAKMLEDMNSN